MSIDNQYLNPGNIVKKLYKKRTTLRGLHGGDTMGIFRNEFDTKRVIFNVRFDLAERLEKAKEISRSFGKKLDVDSQIDKTIERFLKKAEKKLQELSQEEGAIQIDSVDPLEEEDAEDTVEQEE